jgi:hypothetical protein|tara:strand:- start:1034 stop:2020 length:987 start_codon:yes stop_codon:yes gene_type:complete
MGFLDNSGDIILDAVLTETGRKRLATGNFSISKYALGDDEIDYKLYQKNNASGSAYYDLEIMQTPVLEAFTQRNANINYGLITIPNKNLLYMPSILRNEKIPSISVSDKHNVIYLAVKDGVTYDALVTGFGGVHGGGPDYVLESGNSVGRSIILESGLDTAEITGTPANQQNYIVSQGLQERSFQIAVDNRFFVGIWGPGPGSVFNNNGGNGGEIVKFNLTPSNPTGTDKSLRNYALATITAVNNAVYYRTNDARVDTATSVIKGPRSAATALTFSVKPMASNDFARFGSTGATVAGAAGTYSYIDSVVYVRGLYAEYQLPIRIIKKD